MSRIPPLAALTLALFVAACHDVAAPTVSRRVARAELRDARRLAVDVEGREVARLQLAVHGGTLDGGIELELDGKEGEPLVGALELPPGEGYVVEARGYDIEGRLVQAGKGELSVDEELTPQAELALEPVEGGQSWGRVRIGTYRVETPSREVAAGKAGERLEIAMTLVDADGVAHPIEPGTIDVEWPFTPYDPPKPEILLDERKAVIAWEHMGLYGRLRVCVDRRACLDLGILDARPPVQVTAGGVVTCVRRGGGQVTCWGDAAVGQTGQVQGFPSVGFAFTDVSAGTHLERPMSHVCAVDQRGRVWCWGDNSHGQLGGGTAGRWGEFVTKPRPVSLPRPATQVTAGGLHSCALLDDGSAWCWGAGSLGQLGNGEYVEYYPKIDPIIAGPMEVATTERFTQLQAGDLHTCGVTTSGPILCWGHNLFGQVGADPGASPACFSFDTNRTPCEPLPLAVSASVSFVQVAASAGDSCGLASAGDLHCWGHSPAGIANLPVPTTHVPTPVTGGFSWRRVTLGTQFRCGIDAGDLAGCWGRHSDGLLGDGVGMDAPTPRSGSLATPGTIRDIDAGNTHACAIRDDAKVVCWGYARTSTSGLLGFRLPAGQLHSEVPREVTVRY